jgi:hypothetical protein
MATNHSNRFSSLPSENGTMHLELEVCDPTVLGLLEPLEGPARTAKALEALRVGAGVLQMASPTMDLQMVKDEFGNFQKELDNSFAGYFKEKDGILARSLNGYFGQDGSVRRAFLDPNNKQSVLAVFENLLTKMANGILQQFSLDDDGSAMSRLKAILAEGFTGLKEALGIKEAQAVAAEKGHVKGFEFEADLYRPLAEWGRQVGDETQLVRGTPGALKQKWGDYLITLGDTSGAPLAKIVVEVKDQAFKAKPAIEEMEKAKKNREAALGIFVFAKGCEPVEFGDFRQIGNDFYCTADQEAMAQGQSPIFFWAAYQIARAQVVAAIRKEANGKLDLDRVQQEMDGLKPWVDRLGEIFAKAGTIQRSGQAIEETASKMKEDLQRRIKNVFDLLRLSAEE